MGKCCVMMGRVELRSSSVLKSPVPSSHLFAVQMDSVLLMKQSVPRSSSVPTPSCSVAMVPVSLTSPPVASVRCVLLLIIDVTTVSALFLSPLVLSFDHLCESLRTILVTAHISSSFKLILWLLSYTYTTIAIILPTLSIVLHNSVLPILRFSVPQVLASHLLSNVLQSLLVPLNTWEMEIIVVQMAPAQLTSIFAVLRVHVPRQLLISVLKVLTVVSVLP